MILARGAGAASTGGVGVADLFGPLWCSEAVACVLVSMLVRVVSECYPVGGLLSLEFDAVFRRTSVWGVAFDVRSVIK